MTEPTASRRLRIETDHDDRAMAAILARGLRPDNTDEMDTTVDGGRVVTTVRRGTTGGLRATADDYVVNLQVGARVAAGRERNHNSHTDGATTGDTHE